MNKRYKENFLRAGEIAAAVRDYGKGLIVPGARYGEIYDKINKKIVELGGRAAFPPQMSLNEVAAHYLPHPLEEVTFSDELVKLDVGVSCDGAIGDCAVTVDLSGRYGKLVEAAERALANVESSIRVGMKSSEIGKIIEQTITSLGFSPIRNLSGHGLGIYKVHKEPMIPNIDDGSKAVVKPGMTFAVEPFATDGEGSIHEVGRAMIFSFLQNRPLFTEEAKSLSSMIKGFHGLPFALSDLLGKGLTLEEVEFGLQELLYSKAVAGYPPLVERGKGMVAQAENSFLIDEKGKVHISTKR